MARHDQAGTAREPTNTFRPYESCTLLGHGSSNDQTPTCRLTRIPGRNERELGPD